MKRSIVGLLVLLVFPLPARAVIGWRARASEIGRGVRAAIAELPQDLNGAAVAFMEDFDDAAYRELVARVEAHVAGRPKHEELRRSFDGDWGLVDRWGLTENERYQAAARIETLYVALKPVLARPENRDALDRFIESRRLVMNRLKNAGRVLAMAREQIRGFFGDQAPNDLDRAVSLVLTDPGAPTVVPMDARLRKPKVEKGKGWNAERRVPEPEPWHEIHFVAGGDAGWIDRLSSRIAVRASADIRTMLATREDTVAEIHSAPTEEAQRFMQRFPSGAVRGQEGLRYVALTGPVEGMVVNRDGRTVLLLGPDFDSKEGVLSAGRVFVVGAHVRFPIYSHEAVVFDQSSLLGGPVHAPKVYMDLRAKTGDGAVVHAQEHAGFHSVRASSR